MSEPAKGDRLSLPLDGTPVDLAAIATHAGSGGEAFRIVLSGTVSSALDGSLLDAASQTTADARFDMPLVTLPAGARFVESDPVAHRYVIEVASGTAAMPIAFNAAPLATRHLVTLGEARRSLSGAIEVEVLQPPLGPIAAAGARATAIPPGRLAAAGAATLCAFAVGGWLMHRRNREEIRLERRAHAAAKRVTREAALLGPAFESVEESCRRLLQATVVLRRHVEEISAAQRRIRGGRGGAPSSAKRANGVRAAAATALAAQREEALTRLRALVRRLEDASADLAARGPDAAKAIAFDVAAENLDRELAVATRTHQEIRSL